MFKNHKYIAFETIVIKEVRRFTRIWIQTLVPPAITISLYFVIFGNLVGSRIGNMGGFDYMEFIIPGLIMMAVIQNSYSNVVSSFLVINSSAAWRKFSSLQFPTRFFWAALSSEVW